MLTAKTFTGNQLSNLTTAPRPSLGVVDAASDPEGVSSALVKEVEKLEAELKTFIRKGKHLIATIEADKPWLVREEARDLTRYVKKMEPAFTS